MNVYDLDQCKYFYTCMVTLLQYFLSEHEHVKLFVRQYKYGKNTFIKLYAKTILLYISAQKFFFV